MAGALFYPAHGKIRLRQGIGYHEMLVLCTIREYSYCTIRESYFLPKQTIHHMISEMRRDGVLTQDETRSHGREKTFILSDKGEIYAADILKTLDVVESCALTVMLAQFIQALYNIVDSFFVGKYSDSGLTALPIIYPIQLLMIAFAVGTGVGINTAMAARLGMGNREEADEYAGVGTPLAIVLWFLFALVCCLIMPFYARMSTGSETRV